MFIPGDILGGDFDGDGDQDVIFVADIGERTFKSIGSDEDKSYWSTIHLLFNDGTGAFLRTSPATAVESLQDCPLLIVLRWQTLTRTA